MRVVDTAAATLHRLTKHGSGPRPADPRLVRFHPLDPSNRPAPFKRYMGREPSPLPRDLGLGEQRAAGWEAASLGRLLFLTGGVSRVSHGPLGSVTYFRTAMSAGNLHPVEVYVVSDGVDGVAAGVHHYAPLEHGLTTLRRGDWRAVLAGAAAEPAVRNAAATLVLTGIPWRTCWKYGERGFRHLYWDAGAMLANLLAVEPRARVLVGFVDDDVARLVGVDGLTELPLALVVLPSDVAVSTRSTAAATALDTIDLPVEPLAHAPITFPLVTAAQRDGDLADTTAVEGWRGTAAELGRPAVADVRRLDDRSGGPVDAVILRRGSTRLMRRATAPSELLTWGMGVAGQAVDGDFVAAGGTLLEQFVSVHDVDGVEPGAFRMRGNRLERGSRGQHREVAAHLCLDQPLGGDAAFTVFHCATLDPVLEALGSRAYRATQLEAGISSGRLALAAFALGYGATGLTFYDDEVSRFFRTDAACMLVTAVGVPEYRNTRGGAPGAPAELARFDDLMVRLGRELTRRGM